MKNNNIDGVDTWFAPKASYLQLRLEPMRKYDWKKFARDNNISLSQLIIVSVEKYISSQG